MPLLNRLWNRAMMASALSSIGRRQPPLRTACIAVSALFVGLAPEPADSNPEIGRLELSAAARQAITRVHGFHRRAPEVNLGGSDRYLSQLERSTRRIGLLVAGSVGDGRPESRLEALALLKAEFAKWQQLRGEVEKISLRQVRERRFGRAGNSERPLAELELAIRRELEDAERIALLKDDTARQVLGRRQLHRIRGQRIDGPDTFRSPMLSVAIAREGLGEGEQTAGAISGVQSIGVPGTAAPSALEPSRVVVREGQEYRILAPFQGSRGKERSRFALPTDGSSGAEFVDGGARQ